MPPPKKDVLRVDKAPTFPTHKHSSLKQVKGCNLLQSLRSPKHKRQLLLKLKLMYLQVWRSSWRRTRKKKAKTDKKGKKRKQYVDEMPPAPVPILTYNCPSKSVFSMAKDMVSSVTYGNLCSRLTVINQSTLYTSRKIIHGKWILSTANELVCYKKEW